MSDNVSVNDINVLSADGKINEKCAGNENNLQHQSDNTKNKDQQSVADIDNNVEEHCIIVDENIVTQVTTKMGEQSTATNETSKQTLSKNQKKKAKNSTTCKVKICLNMIVRDESRNMIPCMNSVKHLIDAVAIVDTGSEDNTIQVINDYCKEHNIPCEVISKKWIDDFGHSRTEALRHAEDFTNRLDKDKDWYVLIMDADNKAKGYHDDEFPLDKSKLIEDNYSAMHHRGPTIYPYPWILRLRPKGQPIDPPGKKSWKWINSRHEVPTPAEKWTTKTVLLESGYVLSGHSGYRARQKHTFIGDSCALLRDVKKDPEDKRAIFYAAQSLRDAGYYDLAKCMYKRCTEENGWSEERYMAFIHLGRHRLLKEDYKNAVYKKENGKDILVEPAREANFSPKTFTLFWKAYNLSPSRLEAIYYIVEMNRKMKQYNAGWAVATNFIDIGIPNNALFVDTEVYHWKFPEEAGLCAFYAGNKEMYKKLLQKVLKAKDVPQNVLDRTRNNLKAFN